MKNLHSSLFLLSLMMLVVTTALFGQQIGTTVEDLQNNPGKFVNDVVEVKGMVTQYVKGTSTTTSYYLLKGDYGGIIKVNTPKMEVPIINKKYSVTGILYIDPMNKSPFISEQSKSVIEDQTGAGREVIIKEKSSTLTYFLILFVLMIIALLALLYYQFKLKSRAEASSGAPSPEKSEFAPAQDAPQVANELKTVRLVTAPKTMKFIPGELVIVSDADKGKSFKIAGYPTAEGSIVTIGRSKVSGDRAYAHIELGDHYKTVSRKQAEIISRDNKLFVKNLSEVNLTQVDGNEIQPGEMVELKVGAVIKMGELELKYQK